MAKPTEVEVGEQKAPVIQPGHTFASLNEKIGGIVLKRPIKGGWIFGMFICFMILQWFLLAVCWLPLWAASTARAVPTSSATARSGPTSPARR